MDKEVTLKKKKAKSPPRKAKKPAPQSKRGRELEARTAPPPEDANPTEDAGYFGAEAEESDEDSPLSTLFGGSRPGIEFEEDQGEDNQEESNLNLNHINDVEPQIDVFDRCTMMAQKFGDIPKFRIHKNGEHLVTITGSCSYDSLQKKYGGGQYKVWGYRSLGLGPNQGYLYGQTRLVADVAPKTEELEQEQKQSSSDMNAVLDMMKSLMEKNQSSGVDQARVKSESEQGQMTIMMQMMNSMNQMQMKMMQASQENSDKRFEMMMAMFTQSSKTDKNKDEMGFKEILALITSAKKSGAEDIKEIYEMAKEIAEERLSNTGGGDDKKSPIDNIIEALPALAGAFMASKQQPQAPAQQQQLMPARPAQVRPSQLPGGQPAGATVAGRPLVQAQPTQQTPIVDGEGDPMAKSTRQPLITQHQSKKADVTVRPLPGQQPTPQPATQAVAPAAPAAQPGGGVGSIKIDLDSDNDEGDSDGDDLGEPPLNPGEVELGSEKKLKGEINEAGDGEYLPNENDGEVLVDKNRASQIKTGGNFKVQSQIVDLIQTDLVTGFMTGQNAKKVAKSALLTLENNGITADQVLKSFPNEVSILDVAIQKNVPITFQPKLKEFYAGLRAVIQEQINGESLST